ncbi:formate dehydrogenase accessory protein FdhE [Nonomuraea typhae]|uniref:formate dehydrogenase accessory protein FdhE domain-containing protein n=1 Tax=Nonomuraea typhae TaxID=2603600 RepID=UPI0012FC40D2|nr:formate dehydrogenase accessory protein FdhE [Nonomuraea typhae]
MYGRHRARAEELRERHPHAAEVLTLYLALAEVWEAGGGLPGVVRATVAHGPAPLARAVLATDPPPAVRDYLARAARRGPPGTVLEGASARCPGCGGLPQLSFRTASEDPLVSGRRMLQCADCSAGWGFSAGGCPSCEDPRRVVYGEARRGPRVGRHAPDETTLFPHVRVEGCENCRRYLIDIDLGRDPRAVPEVDELAALPLGLYAAERGLTKITPNLMGF